MIKAVVFDLDDTLYQEIDYVKSGYSAVAKVIENKYGILNAEDELMSLFKENHACVFDRFLSIHNLSVTSQTVGELVEVYRNHTPNIKLDERTEELLTSLRMKGYKLGIITDGRPKGQRAKIESLGLINLVDKIVITDELGGVEYRKPNPKAFEMVCDAFGIQPKELLYVGDNPQKDFAIKKYLPVTTAQIVTEEKTLYSDEDFLYNIKSDIIIGDLYEIIKALCGEK